MKAVKILAVLVLVVAVLVGAGLWYLNRFVQSPEFRELAREAVQSALGSQVSFRDMEISLWRGVTLQGIEVANPPGFTGPMVMAEALVLRYRLVPLLQRRVVVPRLTVEKPVVVLARDATGTFNYEKLGATKTTAPSTPTSGAPRIGGVRVEVSNIGLSDGEVTVLNEQGKRLVRLIGMEFRSGVQWDAGKLSGSGEARVRELVVGDSIYVRNVRAPVRFAGEYMELEPVRGELAGGTVEGSLRVKLLGGFRYEADLTGRGSDMATLLREAGTKPVMSGSLQWTAKLIGTGGLPTVHGGGRAEVVNGQLTGVPLLVLLGTLLQIPDLQQLSFTECLLEYQLANNVMTNPVIRVGSPAVRITGHGAMALDTYALQHELTLALSDAVSARLPKQVRGAFRKTDDGLLALDFRATGPYNSPKTDLSQQLIRGTGQQLLEKGLEKMLR